MKFLFLVLILFSISSFAEEEQKINQNNELKKDKQKIFEEKCSKLAVQSKIPEKRLSVFMAECMASLSLGNIDEGEESISTNEKPAISPKKPK
jgi:hypothetical protein